ncbi:hypothetical protein BC936DRAFT_146257 [Jimgerdemannia flammicorona]|uniref:Uncharacterized protein n=1 Tax=Jimgerdemannia flammicorona TaxID=994334 RepID=A0A433DLR1_9FUNG|nr:hypothetical protein BC936DRAFT_146257 [Jimgerdemannia flammicorona]
MLRLQNALHHQNTPKHHLRNARPKHIPSSKRTQNALKARFVFKMCLKHAVFKIRSKHAPCLALKTRFLFSAQNRSKHASCIALKTCFLLSAQNTFPTQTALTTLSILKTHVRPLKHIRIFFMEVHTILSHPIPSHPIPSHPIPSHPIPSHPISSHFVRGYPSHRFETLMDMLKTNVMIQRGHLVPINDEICHWHIDCGLNTPIYNLSVNEPIDVCLKKYAVSVLGAYLYFISVVTASDARWHLLLR